MDDLDVLVEDGKLNLDIMQHVRVTRERLFAQLRHEEIFNLGKVQRVYLEANGSFSIFQFPQEREGLSLVPDMDPELLQEQPKAQDSFACNICGNLVKEQETKKPCARCETTDWSVAMRC